MVKAVITVPKSFADFCKTQEAKEKPYNICLICEFISASCDGPNIEAMDYKRWSEWANDYLRQTGKSKSELAKKIDMPLSTLSHALSGNGYDIRADTKNKITNGLLGICKGRFPCQLAAMLMSGEGLEESEDGAKIAELRAEIDQLNEEINRITTATEARMEETKREFQAKIDYLKEQVAIRDKYLAEKNETINKLVDKILSE